MDAAAATGCGLAAWSLRYLVSVSADVSPVVQSDSSPLLKAAVTMGVLAVVVALALGVRWWTRPSIFGDLGDSFASSEPLPVAAAALSTTAIFPKVDGEPETVTIDGAQAVFSNNTAKAKVTFSICHLGVDEDPIGAVHDPANYCQDIVPLEAGASFRYGVAPDSDYLFVTIAPTTRGVAHLAQVEVEYTRKRDHLYQRGTESIRVDRKVTAK